MFLLGDLGSVCLAWVSKQVKSPEAVLPREEEHGHSMHQPMG